MFQFPIIVIAEGGLGNQLFQAAFGIGLSERFRKRLVFFSISRASRVPRVCELANFGFDVIEPSKLVATVASVALRVLRKLRVNRMSSSFLFDEDGIGWPDSCPLLVHGYWQKHYFYTPGLGELRRRAFELQCRHSSFDGVRDLLHGNHLAVHVRRGDYVTDPRAENLHNVCTREYFLRAANAALVLPTVDKVMVFSDDPGWARESLSFPRHTEYVEPVRSPSWVDLLRMSRCGHFVISNSSYSFWAAALCTGLGGQKYAPALWFKNVHTSTLGLLDSSWHQIDVSDKNVP